MLLILESFLVSWMLFKVSIPYTILKRVTLQTARHSLHQGGYKKRRYNSGKGDTLPRRAVSLLYQWERQLVGI